MPGASERSAILLADIAILLGTTPEAFRQPAVLDAMRQEYVDVIAACLATDPQFRRIAQAFLDVGDPAGRRAIADSVEAIAGPSQCSPPCGGMIDDGTAAHPRRVIAVPRWS